jgi:hypothetical protein
VVASNVQEFGFAYDTRSTTTQSYSESAEFLLASNDPAIATFGDQRINSSQMAGQYFTPSLPQGAVSWRVTRVRLKTRAHGAAQGQTNIQLRPVGGGTPSGNVIDQASQSEATLGASYSWQQFNFTRASNLAPGTAMCIILDWVSDADSCDVQYQTLGVNLSGSYYLFSSNGGSTWSANVAQSLIYYAYGTITTADAPLTQYFLTGVRCQMRAGGDASAKISGAMRALNEPQVSGP